MPVRLHRRIQPRREVVPVMRVSAVEARQVLLRLQGLTSTPLNSTHSSVQSTVELLGYVQIDSINVLERAHHLILGTRLDGYRHAHLAHTLEVSRGLFEHWTHDACAIPTKWYPHWKHRFARSAVRIPRSAWWKSQLGDDAQAVIRKTLARIRRDGPLRARDFEKPDGHASKGWWEWHPQKAALEHLWRCGKLAVTKRERFEKVYDLAQRVHPEGHAQSASSKTDHVDWACREAMARLGIATATELAHFFQAITPAQARAWCASAVSRGELLEVEVEQCAGGRATTAFALTNWREFTGKLQREGMVLLCPFDPAIRQRGRLERLFDFDYRFEAFTPAAKRVHGYYTMPILEGDALIGRVDPKFDRAASQIIVRGPWWEPGVKVTRARRASFGTALDRLAHQLGAARWRLEAP